MKSLLLIEGLLLLSFHIGWRITLRCWRHVLVLLRTFSLLLYAECVCWRFAIVAMVWVACAVVTALDVALWVPDTLVTTNSILLPLAQENCFDWIAVHLYPLKRRLAWKWLQIGTDMLLIITSVRDKLFRSVNIDDLEWPWIPKIEGFSESSEFFMISCCNTHFKSELHRSSLR